MSARMETYFPSMVLVLLDYPTLVTVALFSILVNNCICGWRRASYL